MERSHIEGWDLVGGNGLLKGLVKLVLEGALEAGMNDRLALRDPRQPH
ncbi:hypothetical protein [Streptomyces sp. Ncost-T10-10d]|nr:hypothetical protein [Streptomyces sp. Ncost-T10-10d]